MSLIREFRKDYSEFEEEEKTNKETEHLKSVRDMVHSIKLKKGATAEEEKELQKRKEETDKLLAEVLSSIKNYKFKVDTIENNIKRLYENSESSKDLQGEVQKLDLLRKMAHDALIQSVKKAIGFINYNFGDIDKNILTDWEDKQAEAGKLVLDVERVKFPKNVICPDNVDLNNRKSVADWAFKLTKIDRI